MTLWENKFQNFKHGNVAELSDTIVAYDFEPIEGRDDRFVVGHVCGLSLNCKGPGYAHYEIRVIASSHGQYQLDETVYVPVETTMDYDGRIKKVTSYYGNDAAIREDIASREFWV